MHGTQECKIQKKQIWSICFKWKIECNQIVINWVFPIEHDHGEGDLMVPSKFKTLITMSILCRKYNFNSYETYGWICTKGSLQRIHPW
jgi:hypothetical protein